METINISALPSSASWYRFWGADGATFATDQGLAVASYSAVRGLIRDKRAAGPGLGFLERQGITDGARYDAMKRGLYAREAEDHAALKSLVAAKFTSASVGHMRAVAADMTDRILDHAPAGEEIARLCETLPLSVMCTLLGLDLNLVESLRPHTRAVGRSFGLAAGPFKNQIDEGQVNMERLVADALAQGAFSSDGLTADFFAMSHARTIDRAQLVSMVTGLLFAGHETTRGQLGLMALAFAEHPDAWKALRSKPTSVAPAVQEVLRLYPVAPFVVAMARDAIAEGVVEGVRAIEAGEWIVLVLASGNRDPAAFVDPERFDIARSGPPLLTFGGGMHRCLGEHLAVLELEAALAGLRQRFRGFELAAPATFRGAGEVIAGLDHLPLAPLVREPAPTG
jgi:cytochrome P450